MYRDILLAYTDTPSDDAALEAAAALAEACQARLLVSMVLHLPRVTTPYGLAAIPGDGTYTDVRRAWTARQRELRERLAATGVASEVHLTETATHSARQLVAAHARYADLVVVAAPGPTGPHSALLHGFFSTLVMSAGRPVLAVPEGAQPRFPPDHAVVGWSPTPEAARAVHDALPLLRAARSVEVVMVEPERGEGAHGEEPGADIATHLARHGVQVRATASEYARGTVGAHLLVSAHETGAQLVVAGAYGHSRAREWAFGGATRELLERSHVPVLFSH